jgi:sec-independent protein translocase protein TatB
MFGLGISEVILILGVAIVFVGPDKLPELAQKIGRLVWQVKHSAEELRKEIALPNLDSEFNPLKDEVEDLKNINKSLEESVKK